VAGGPVTDPAQKKADLIVEADELWSFVGSKADVQWVWVALDADTRRVLAMVVGDRSDFTARCLWESLPAAYRDEAVFCTDFLPAYRAVIPEERHAAAGKDAGLTNHVERFWCTLRQRCARVVRKTLSFSKCLENHVGAFWFFIHLYNASRA
jgi:insertion element IS1 protein InsB